MGLEDVKLDPELRSMAIDPSQLIARLKSLAPFEDDSAARRALDVTLTALRRGLADDEADWLALGWGRTWLVRSCAGIISASRRGTSSSAG